MEDVELQVKTLEKLGLTPLQAKIYLTAVTLQKASVGRIAEKSEVARTDVYRIVPALEKLGLLKKIISTPTMYEATALKDGCALLLQRKKEEYTEAKLKAKELVEEFQKKTPKQASQIGTEGFSIINSKELLLERFSAADASTTKSLDIISDWSTVRFLLFTLESYDKLRARGVKVRIITEKPTAVDKKHKELSKQSGDLFEIRYLDKTVPMGAAVYDGKVANLRVRTQQDNDLTPSLWSDNPAFVRVIMAYYETLWKQAQKPAAH
jgi:sugar-specific transcriptional regulator TrmB